MLEPRTLVLDIETSPLIAYVWGRKDQYIATNQIKEDWHIIAWGAKWLNSQEVMYSDSRKRSEKSLLEELWTLLNKADIVITQNGQSFDGPKINARFIMLGIKPPSPYKHLDTYKIAKRVADFTSNSLEYLTDKLCVKHKKLSHSQFPGMSLWVECLAGNMKAWDEMKRYNIKDVLSTEELYNKLKDWVPANMPDPKFMPIHSVRCSVCGRYARQTLPHLKPYCSYCRKGEIR